MRAVRKQSKFRYASDAAAAVFSAAPRSGFSFAHFGDTATPIRASFDASAVVGRQAALRA